MYVTWIPIYLKIIFHLVCAVHWKERKKTDLGHIIAKKEKKKDNNKNNWMAHYCLQSENSLYCCSMLAPTGNLTSLNLFLWYFYLVFLINGWSVEWAYHFPENLCS